MALLRCIAFLACATVVSGQSLPVFPRPVQKDRPDGMAAFDVVSVVPSATNRPEARIETPAGDRFTATNTTLLDLIGFAYDVEDARLLDGPGWIGVERFDIDAKAERALPAWSGSGPPMPLLLMVRRLLADRFGLVVHQETRDLPVYTLLVARDDRKFGPEITASKLTCDDPVGTQCDSFISQGRVGARGYRMAQFAAVLSSLVQRVVIDRTQLSGTFDFGLTWTPDADHQSLVRALREQLGLTLDAMDAPLEVLVIDRVEHPASD